MEQRQKRHTHVAAFILLGLMAVVVFRGVSEGAGNGSEPPLVGTVVVLTGYLAGINGPFIDGVKLAAKRINASGRAAGYPTQLHIVDGASTATTGVTIAKQVLSQYKIAIMINGASSATNQALLPIIARRQVPVISQGQVLMIEKAAQTARSITGSSLRAALEALTIQGSEFLYRFTPEDHSDQQSAPSPLVIAQAHGASPAFGHATK